MARERWVAQAEDSNRLVVVVSLLPTFNNARPKSHVRTPRVSLAAILVMLVAAAPFATQVSGLSPAGGMGVCQRFQRGQVCRRGRQRYTTVLAPRPRPMMVATDGSISLPSSSSSSSPGSPKSSSAIPSIAPASIAIPGGSEEGGGVVEATLGGARGSASAVAAATVAAGVAAQRAQRLRVGTFFFLWYTFNIGYNLCTKFT